MHDISAFISQDFTRECNTKPCFTRHMVFGSSSFNASMAFYYRSCNSYTINTAITYSGTSDNGLPLLPKPPQCGQQAMVPNYRLLYIATSVYSGIPTHTMKCEHWSPAPTVKISSLWKVPRLDYKCFAISRTNTWPWLYKKVTTKLQTYGLVSYKLLPPLFCLQAYITDTSLH